MQMFTKGQRVEVLSSRQPNDNLVRERAWYPATVDSVDDYGHVWVVRDDAVACIGWFYGDLIRPLAAPASGLEALTRAYLELGPNARRILEFIAARLVVGKAHGDFDKPRDYDRETAEEECDGAVYRAAKLLGIGAPKAGS